MIPSSSTTTVTEIHSNHCLPKASWGAILAGVTVSLIIATLFNLLGLGLSLMAFKVDAEGMQTLGIGGIVWILLTGFVSMLIGGWVAGHFGKSHRKVDGMLYGMVAWGISTMVTFAFLTTTVGTLLSGTADILGQAISATGKAAGAITAPLANSAQQTITMDNFFNTLQQQGANLITQQQSSNNQNQQQSSMSGNQDNTSNNGSEDNNSANNTSNSQANMMQQSAGNNMDMSNIQITPQLRQAITDFVTAANDNDQQTARNRLVQIITQTSNLSQDQAEARVDQWQQTYQQVRDQAIEATEQGTTMLGTIPLFAFFTLLLSGIAASIGGAMGIAGKNKYQQM